MCTFILFTIYSGVGVLPRRGAMARKKSKKRAKKDSASGYAVLPIEEGWQ
jgi:hypothetical protein